MAYCDSIMLSSPYPGPKLMGRAEDRRARVLERGNTLEPCPGCGGEAEVEPPCTVLRDGLEQMVVCRRCPRCGPSWSVGGIPDLTPEEEVMPQVSPEATACECGCGEPAAPGKRFATTTCGKRWSGRQGAGKPRRRPGTAPGECECGCGKPPARGSKYASRACTKRAWRARQAPAAQPGRAPVAPVVQDALLAEQARVASWPAQPDEPTPSQGLCVQCGVAVGERWQGLCSVCADRQVWRARQAPAPAPAHVTPPEPTSVAPVAVVTITTVTARQVLDYLLTLTREQREALADVVAAEEACVRLGVVL